MKGREEKEHVNLINVFCDLIKRRDMVTRQKKYVNGFDQKCSKGPSPYLRTRAVLKEHGDILISTKGYI